MSYELLLEWVSERGSGSWAEFREAHDWLFEPAESTGKRRARASTTALGLSTLGHMEIDWQGGTWAAAPPVLTILPRAGAHAILSGARTRAIKSALAGLTDETGDLFLERYQQEWGPDAYFIAAADETGIERLAEDLGVVYEPCISERIAQLLPPLDTYVAQALSTPPAKGYGVKRFSTKTLHFAPTDDDSAPGLYEYGVNRRSEYRWLDNAGTYYTLDRSMAVYAELWRCGQTELRYEPESINGTLVVPFGAPLPTLQARTAVLCCGLTPSLENSRWRYPNVPADTARRIADSLAQELPL